MNGFHVPNDNKFFRLSRAEIACFDRDKYELLQDFTIITEMAKVHSFRYLIIPSILHVIFFIFNMFQILPESDGRAAEALFVANEMMNLMWMDDRSTWPEAKQVGVKFLAKANAPDSHSIYAIGHCRITCSLNFNNFRIFIILVIKSSLYQIH